MWLRENIKTPNEKKSVSNSELLGACKTYIIKHAIGIGKWQRRGMTGYEHAQENIYHNS